jgi:hypothetical protein
MRAPVTEQALRGAVMRHYSPDLSKVKDEGKALKEAVMDQAKPQGVQMNNLQAEMIGLAVAGVAVAYTAVAYHLDKMEKARVAFEHELVAGVASFMIRNDKMRRDFSKQERAIYSFFELINNKCFENYLGIHTAELTTDKSGTFYSVIPYYSMSQALPPDTLSSSKRLDKKRSAIGLFLKYYLSKVMTQFDISFQTESKLWSFCKSIIGGNNYLNDFRAARFIIVALANLLWNLEHLVDPITGYPLNTDRCIEICHLAEIFLKQLLDRESPPYLDDILSNEQLKNTLQSFIERLVFYTKALRSAYAEEQLHALNLHEISNSAHRTLRILDSCIYEIIYLRVNPLNKRAEPDKNAAGVLADWISNLTILLQQNPGLLAMLQPLPTWIPAAAGMNFPLATTVDLLILFSHVSSKEAAALHKNIEAHGVRSAKQLSYTLRQFQKDYVQPVRDLCKKELKGKKGFFSVLRKEEIGQLTAQRLVPFISLLIADYRLEVDIEDQESLSPQHSLPSGQKSGRQQVQAINATATQDTAYYQWKLSPFVGGEEGLNILPKSLYRLTQVTELMDNINDLVRNYRSFLMQKSFQDFLLDCLERIKKEITHLEEDVKRADTHLDRNEHISNGLQSILGPMIIELNNSLQAFSTATVHCEHIVNDPNFISRQRLVLDAKLTAIAQQYETLFKEQCVLTLGSASSSPAPTPVPETPQPVFVNVGRILALHKLIHHCYDALSLQSKQGRKGTLMNNLLHWVEQNAEIISETQLQHVLKELARVVDAYRPTMFFQAKYAHTRSSSVLVAAIKDRQLNQLLPLAITFFDPQVNVQQISDDDLHRRLLSFGQRQGWEENGNRIQLNLLALPSGVSA